jgi:arabinose-5-phosphate isomerase
MSVTPFDDLSVARHVLADELAGLQNLISILDESFERACELVRNCQGRIIFCGVGQSWHVGRKTACSMSSLGKPSFYLHATEAIHGDMGLITSADVVVMISHSGETKEILNALGPILRIGARTIAMTSNPQSTLARECDIALVTGVKQEGGPIKFAPSTSAVVTTALGDALVMAVATSLGFTQDDYSRYHPGGAIGQKLLGDKAL